MTINDAVTASASRRERTACTRHYAMTPPTFFAIEYSINPWMHLGTPVDVPTAMRQWQQLYQTYVRLGHAVDLVRPEPGLPDMVYAANGGLVVNNTAIVARFAHDERAGEEAAYAQWMAAHGHDPIQTRHTNEGQGDLLVIGEMVLGGYGFRTDPRAHSEVAELLRMPVISLELVDPRFYHLDTALAVLDDNTIAYYPPAFSDAARRQLRALFPDAIIVGTADAYAFGLNAVSDGRHVVYPSAATGLAHVLHDAGFEPVAVELTELLKGGGSVKCCTLEVHP
jgi:N-dimethylarginine dimethylaminohydrolase